MQICEIIIVGLSKANFYHFQLQYIYSTYYAYIVHIAALHVLYI